MKCLDKTKLTPLIRICAALSLVVWLAALTFCSANCFLRDSHCQPNHHDEQAADAHPDHDHDQAPASKNHNGCDDSFCDSLKAFSHTTDTIVIAKPDFGLAYILASTSFSQLLTVPQSETSMFRQARQREWVFTPEVYLGPAFRSQAPPVLLS